ncbi:MAG: MATE family efflux transporter [Eubacteriales bacterium]|nr:MATE family efflux transporter [Eubacteriales bacterium]
MKYTEVKKKNYEMDMCSGPIFRKMLMFTFPIMCSGVLQLLFNAADVVVVGQFAGHTALAAVGANSSLINLLTNLFIGLSIGTNVLTARYYGAKKQERLSRSIHTSMLLSIYSGIILTIIGFLFAKGILVLMQTPENVLNQAVLYIRLYFLGMTGTMIYNFGSAILRATGDTKRPLYYLLAAGVINVVLNVIFVAGFSMGVAGVAIATAISQFISAGLIIRCLLKETGALKLEVKKLRIVKQDFMDIVRVGLPAGFQGMLFSLSNVIIQSAVNGFGDIVVAGNSAAMSIEGFVYISMNAFYQATISFTSQNVGAKRYDRILKILLSGQAAVIMVGFVLGNMAVLFGNPLLSIYSSDPEVIAAGVERIGIICSIYFTCGMMDVMVGALRGLGYSVMPMIVSLLGACGLRLLWIATVFQIPEFHKITTVYVSYPITWVVTFTAHVICFVVIYRKTIVGKEKGVQH